MPATPSPLQVQDLMRDSRFNPNDWRKLRAASEWSKDAVIDDEGKIVDIPTTEGCYGLPTKDLQNRSGLDLSRVKRRYVCIET